MAFGFDFDFFFYYIHPVGGKKLYRETKPICIESAYIGRKTNSPDNQF